jgi:hypothetical protein
MLLKRKKMYKTYTLRVNEEEFRELKEFLERNNMTIEGLVKAFLFRSLDEIKQLQRVSPGIISKILQKA